MPTLNLWHSCHLSQGLQVDPRALMWDIGWRTDSRAVGQRVGTSPRVAGSGCGSLPTMASDCQEETAPGQGSHCILGKTREGNWAATTAPYSFLASGRNSWTLGISCRQSTCSSSGLKPGVLCDTPLQKLGEPLTSHVTSKTASVHGPSVTWPGSPGMQPAGVLGAGYQNAFGGAAC